MKQQAFRGKSLNVRLGSGPDVGGVGSEVRCWVHLGHQPTDRECLFVATSAHRHLGIAESFALMLIYVDGPC